MPVYYDKKRKTYYVSVYVELKDGTKKRIMRRGFKTQREAKKAENDIIFEYAQKSSDNPLFSEFLDEYIERYEKTRKKSTYDNVKLLIDLHYKPQLGDKKIQDIKNKEIMKFHDYLIDNFAASTAKNMHITLSTIFNHAVKSGILTKNPCKDVGMVDIEDDNQIRFWTLDEFKRFMSVVNHVKYKALFMLLFYSGARIGEALALEWRDIDFDNNSVIINKRVYKLAVDTPKTKTSIRVNKIPQHTIDRLQELKLKVKPQDDYYVFGKHKTPLTNEAAWIMLKKYIKDAGVTDITLHDFRHSHASYLIDKGHDIQIISKRLGHKNTSTTWDIYAHLYPNKESEMVMDMEDDFKKAEVIRLIK